MFRTSNGTEGLHIESSIGRSVVVVTYSPYASIEEDKRYYLGIQRWSPNTEVKEIK